MIVRKIELAYEQHDE